MNYLNAAKVLDELMLELIDRGAQIPIRASEEFKAGRSFASIYARSKDDAEIAMKAGSTLESVEMNLLALAEIACGAAYAEDWQRRVMRAYQEAPALAPFAPRMVRGAPKGAYWVRVQSTELSKRPEASGLSAIPQEDGFTLIYGRKEDVTAFLKQISQKGRA